MSLSLDIGGGGIVLRVQRVELRVEPMLGRDPRIDRTGDGSDGWSLHGRPSVVDRSSLSRRPKKRGPFHLVPVMAKATLQRLSYVCPLQANPSALPTTRRACHPHSRPQTAPDYTSVRSPPKL